MTTQRAQKLRKLYGIALSLVLVIAGICLMAACLNIYQSGEGTFSRQIVAAHFSGIAVPVYLCLAMVILGFVLDIFLPCGKEKNAVEKNDLLILQRLHEKTDLSLCDEALQASVAREQAGRKRSKIITLVLLAVGSIVFLCYALNGSNYHQQQITDSLIRAMLILAPCMLIPFAYAVFSAYSNRASIRREIELLRRSGANRSPAPRQEPQQSPAPMYLRWGILAVALIILVYGFFAGGTADVLTKAINICTECVGLG